MAKVIKRVTVDIEIPDEIFEKIIDNVTEFMYCNFGKCHMQCSWKELEEIRDYIKTEGLDKVKDIWLNQDSIKERYDDSKAEKEVSNMITMFIIIFFSTVYLLGWLAIIILKGIVGAIGNLFKLNKKNKPTVDDDIIEIQTTDSGEWGRL